MSNLSALPIGSFLPRPAIGYVTRQRVPVEGADLAALDDEVKAASGWIERKFLPSNEIGGGCHGQAGVEATWYVIPADAVEA